MTDHTPYIQLLQQLIQTQSYSGEENQTADIIAQFMTDKGIEIYRDNNNVWAFNKFHTAVKPYVLLNSHHDTVKPNKGYTRDPFEASIENNTLYGLGSNDAGGCLVSLLALFIHFYEKENLNYNLIFAATAEEENSGPNGIRSVIPQLPEINFAVVGEPTQMNLAIAEKGLMVIDGTATGVSGHAAHENTVNAIYKALEDIAWIKDYQFEKVSAILGKVKMNVTQINAGTQHNVVPAECHFVIDVRVNEHYSNQEIFDTLQVNTQSELKARSFRHSSSSIPLEHPIVQAGIALGRSTYGSPTLSDQAALTCPSLKLGPGDSTRSHQADEYILVSEIEEGIELYIQLFCSLLYNQI
ncbi:MAG: acetylornithine deacetylase [Crocinitomicaceae bacterium]|nr:acetylornithine deacetylase [Crocinitomicaceae bacterium]|tara:strand:+ start:17 stop:1081 length:1065 start_codon:yes stop_codon:yes gene_type:complete